MGDTIFQLIAIGSIALPILLIIIVLIFVIRSFRRMEGRAEERLKLDKENAAFQEQQMKTNSELNNRLTKIENMLKEVD